MADRSLVFPSGEYRRRIVALQDRMQAAGQDALLLTTPADVFYTTGFLTRFWESPARPWFVIVPASGKPVAVIPEIGRMLMNRTWIEDIRTWPAPDPDDDGVQLLSEALSDAVPPSGVLGIPMGLETHLRMPMADYREMARRLAPRHIVDATDTLQRVREIKSEEEIGLIRATCDIAATAFDRVPDLVQTAPRLDRVFRAFQSALLEAGADWVSYLAGGAGQDGYDDVISPAGPQELVDGDVLMLDTGAVRHGYFCDFDRNFAIGRPTDPVRRAQDALFDATETCLREIRPGMRASDVHRLLAGAIEAAGFESAGGRLGHGLGVTLTEWPSFTDRDTTLLCEGMVLTLEPSVRTGPGRMIVHEENFVLRAEGAELLSRRAPAQMPVIPL